MIRAPREMSEAEVTALLGADVPAHLATLDRHGFPHVTPLWFVWAQGAFHLTSLPDRPHLARLRRNPRAGICVDLEQPGRPDGERPNRQVRAVGEAQLLADEGALWTRRITGKYVRGPAAAERVSARAGTERVLIRLRPLRLIAVASV